MANISPQMSMFINLALTYDTKVIVSEDNVEIMVGQPHDYIDVGFQEGSFVCLCHGGALLHFGFSLDEALSEIANMIEKTKAQCLIPKGFEIGHDMAEALPRALFDSHDTIKHITDKETIYQFFYSPVAPLGKRNPESISEVFLLFIDREVYALSNHDPRVAQIRRRAALATRLQR